MVDVFLLVRKPDVAPWESAAHGAMDRRIDPSVDPLSYSLFSQCFTTQVKRPWDGANRKE